MLVMLVSELMYMYIVSPTDYDGINPKLLLPSRPVSTSNLGYRQTYINPSTPS
jgi:hypothetical protein